MSSSERSKKPTKAELSRARVKAPSRVIIESVEPQIDGGAFPIKRVQGEEVDVSANVFVEGHDLLRVLLLSRQAGDTTWRETPMTATGNDRWEGQFRVAEQGWYEYTVQAWVDSFGTWVREIDKKGEAKQDLASELLEGAVFLKQAASRATDAQEAAWLLQRAKDLEGDGDQFSRRRLGMDPELTARILRWADRTEGAIHEPLLRVRVERERARYGAWYEMFPRSASNVPGKHGTFKDVEERLPYIAGMGFDVLYLPPIHPIGRSFRKGPNNTLTPGPNDPGSPWAIGSEEGGHTAIHPELGTIEDFDHLVAAAARHGIEIALDIAFQCSPDHPWVKEHPEWFRHRPDGTIKYAENPPKKYQDIYPLDFEGPAWKSLWEALRDVFLFWVDHGVTIFRVDNPHTKPFRFWDWVIDEVWNRHPDTIFLSEAFTRPKHDETAGQGRLHAVVLLLHLAQRKARAHRVFHRADADRVRRVHAAQPLRQHARHSARIPSGRRARPAFKSRLVLAATLGATYGIYGPPFELCVGNALQGGSEEYYDSEKYQIRHWDLNRPGSLRDYIARVNTIRRNNPALHDIRIAPVCARSITPSSWPT